MMELCKCFNTFVRRNESDDSKLRLCNFKYSKNN